MWLPLTSTAQPRDQSPPAFVIQMDGEGQSEHITRPPPPPTRPLPDPLIAFYYFTLCCLPNVACYVRLLVLVNLPARLTLVEAWVWVVVQTLSISIPIGMCLYEHMKNSHPNWSPRLRTSIQVFQFVGLALSIFVPMSLLWTLIHAYLRR